MCIIDAVIVTIFRKDPSFRVGVVRGVARVPLALSLVVSMCRLGHSGGGVLGHHAQWHSRNVLRRELQLRGEGEGTA